MTIGQEEFGLIQEKGALVGNNLAVATVWDNTSLFLQIQILLLSELGKAPFVGDEQLLSARELILCTAQGLKGVILIAFLRSHRQKCLADLNTGYRAKRLSEGTSHSRLESIGTCARKHLVNTQDVERVSANAEMEGILSARLGHVLVARNTGGFKGLGRKLLFLIGN